MYFCESELGNMVEYYQVPAGIIPSGDLRMLPYSGELGDIFYVECGCSSIQ